MFSFADRRPRTRISLTPMIDVVFLLLVFFMLVAQFGQDQAIPVNLVGDGVNEWQGPPRLVDIAPSEVRLNGVPMDLRLLLLEMVRLTETGDDPVILRPIAGARLGRVVEVMEIMGRAGFENLSLMEGRE